MKVFLPQVPDRFTRPSILALFFLLVSVTQGCDRSGDGTSSFSSQSAKDSLVEKNIPFTVAELHQSAVRGDLEVLRLLLDAGMDVNSRDEKGSTALMWAASQGHLKVVQLLLDYKADPNARDGDGWTALMTANALGYTQTAQLLMEHGAR